MDKARDFKTFPQATYPKINFSLDLFLQLYFKILKYLFLVLKNWDTKSKTQILFIFFKWTIKSTKKHTHNTLHFQTSLNISQNIWYVLDIFIEILCKIKTCKIKYINVISMLLSVNGLYTLQYMRYKGFSKYQCFFIFFFLIRTVVFTCSITMQYYLKLT